MATKRKSSGPIDIDALTWMYAEPKGLCVVREVKRGAMKATEMFYLPWSKVRRALAVKDKETPNG